jgi:hypothetical protein
VSHKDTKSSPHLVHNSQKRYDTIQTYPMRLFLNTLLSIDFIGIMQYIQRKQNNWFWNIRAPSSPQKNLANLLQGFFIGVN